MNAYQEMSKRHLKEFSALPIFYAFSEARFAQQMRERGLEPSDTDKVRALGDSGGFYLVSDAEELQGLTERHRQEREAAIASDRTGAGFIYEMFLTELLDYEYRFTDDTADALDALGYTEEDLASDPRLKHGLDKACAHIHKKET